MFAGVGGMASCGELKVVAVGLQRECSQKAELAWEGGFREFQNYLGWEGL